MKKKVFIILILSLLFIFLCANEIILAGKEELNVHFFPIGEQKDSQYLNAITEGDSYIITVGNIEILVDAGVNESSAPAIKDKMKELVSSDNKWDYIIVSHADKDHIGAFGTNNGNDGVFELFLKEKMTLGTLIDFDITNDDTNDYPNKELLFDTDLYGIYKTQRDLVIAKGVNYFTASECCWEKRNVVIDKKVSNIFYLSNNYELEILYNYYYDHKYNDKGEVTALDRNNLSVCFTINDISNKDKKEIVLLSTGDLEQFDSANAYKEVFGETLLVENNPQLKKGVKLFKAAHHGSRTSNSKAFIDSIRPDHVYIPAIAGNNSHNHDPNSDTAYPATVVMDAFFKYTDKIYMPSVAEYDNQNNKTIVDYYGAVKFIYDGKMDVKVTENYSNSDGVWGDPIDLQETTWYQQYRNCILNTFAFSTFISSKQAYLGSCTLVKYGHYDILIDCGVLAHTGRNAIQSRELIKKIQQYCVDNILECIIISNSDSDAIQQMVQTRENGQPYEPGVLDIFEVEKIIDYGKILDPTNNAKYSLYKEYNETLNGLIDEGKTEYISASENQGETIKIAKDLSVTILHNKNYQRDNNEDVCVTVNFNDKKLLFTGSLEHDGEKELVTDTKNDLNNVVYYEVSNMGSNLSNSQELLDAIDNPDLYIVANSIGNYGYGFDPMNYELCNRLIECTSNTYLTCEFDEKEGFKEIMGDIVFSIVQRNEENTYEIYGEKADGTVSNMKLEDSEFYKDFTMR